MTEPDDDAWRLPIGETLDESRARLILARFGPEAKRVGQERVARLRASNPTLQVEARVFGVDTLLRHYAHPRDAQDVRITLGMVAYVTASGGQGVIAIVLEWGTGRVLTTD